MTDVSGKTTMAIGETDDPNAVIESCEAAAAITKGDPVYLSADDKVSPAAAAQDCIGIATKDAASGKQCSVLTKGRVKHPGRQTHYIKKLDLGFIEYICPF